MGRSEGGALLLILAIVAGCSTPVAPTPSPPTIMVIGTVSAIRVADPHRLYVLVDGREIEISTATTRVLFEGGVGQPLVYGRDDRGEFLAVFTSQGGLPGDCHLPGIGPDATNRGDYVEIAGVLWRKAPTFRSIENPVAGDPYAGSTRFCFNERAEVAYTIP